MQRKTKTFLAAATSCLLLTACGTDDSTSVGMASDSRTEQASAADSTAESSVTQTDSIAESTAAQTESSKKQPIVYEVEPEGGFHFYQTHCPVAPVENTMTCRQIDFPLSINEKRVWIWGFLNEETVLVVLTPDKKDETQELGTISLHDGEVGTFQKLTALDSARDQVPNAWNDRWIVISEAAESDHPDWNPPHQYRMFDMQTKTMGAPFWKEPIDENGYAVGGGNFNQKLFIGDTVYFDAYSMEHGELTATLYRYDIGSGKIIETYPDCQKPMLYQGQLIAFTRNDSGNYRRLISVKDNGASFQFECGDQLMSIEPGPDGIYAITNEGEDDVVGLTISKLQNLTTGKDIFSANAAIGKLHSSEDLVVWSRETPNYDVTPAVYDIANQRLITLKEEFTMDEEDYFFTHTMGKTTLVQVMNASHTESETLLLKMP